MADGVVTGIRTITSFSIPSDLSSSFSNINLLRYVQQLQGNKPTTGKAAKCFVVNNTVKIVDCGQFYLDSSSTNSYITQIQDDNQQFQTVNGNIVTGFSYRFKFKPKTGATLAQSVNWMLVPPAKMDPGAITKNTKLSGGMINSFSQSTTISALALVENIKTSKLPAYKTVVSGQNVMPLPINQGVATITYKTDSSNVVKDLKGFVNDLAKEVGTKAFAAVKNLKITDVSYSSSVYDVYPPYVYEAVKSGVGEDRDFFSEIYFNGTASESILSKVANDTAVASIVLPVLGPTSDVLAIISLLYDTGKNISISTKTGTHLVADSFDPDIIIDGTATWEKRDSFLDILSFEDNYFNSPTLINGGQATKISNIEKDKETVVNFRKFTTGIIGSVETPAVNSVNYPSGTCFVTLNLPTYSVDVNNDNFSLADGTCIKGTGGQLYITFGGPPTSPYGYITSVLVQEGGAGYASGSYTLNASAIAATATGKVNELVFSVTSNVVLLGEKFVAVPTADNGNPFNIFNNTASTGLKNYGLEIGVCIATGATNILNAGDGYVSGDKIYINQLDNNLNSLMGADFDPEVLSKTNMEKMPYITIIAPSASVVNKGSCLDPAASNLLFNDTDPVKALYNFWDDSPAVYNECPQQIALMDSYHREYFNNQGVSINKGIRSILTSDTVEGFTVIENLKTIQFQELNYRSDGMSPNINGQSYLQIGRFIPYQELRPPVRTSTTEDIPTTKGTAVWTNYNWCQFIPYGIENFYQKQFISLSNVATF